MEALALRCGGIEALRTCLDAKVIAEPDEGGVVGDLEGQSVWRTPWVGPLTCALQSGVCGEEFVDMISIRLGLDNTEGSGEQVHVEHPFESAGN